jgi:hypothetical protein
LLGKCSGLSSYHPIQQIIKIESSFLNPRTQIG